MIVPPRESQYTHSMNSPSTNPYRPLADDDGPGAPFAGRAAAFARLDQYLKAPAPAGAPVYTGAPGSGKTAFLRAVEATFDDGHLGVALPLAQITPPTVDGVLRACARQMAAALVRHNLSTSRLPPIPHDHDDWRTWFADDWLPDLLRAARPHRQVVLLLDDAERLFDPGLYPLCAYLADVMRAYPQIRPVLALDATRELDLAALSPLVDPAAVHRLAALTQSEVAALLRDPVDGRYTIDDAGVLAVYEASGGDPRLLQRFGFHLCRHQEARPDITTLTPSAVRTVAPLVYVQSESEFNAQWAASSYNERLVLTAISGLIYAAPLNPITAETIEAWLVETDYPLDRTAINAALRGLAYREILSAEGALVRVRAGLMQQWLLEHARMGDAPTTRGRRPRMLIALAALAALILLALALALGRTPQAAPDAPPPPTITLNSGG